MSGVGLSLVPVAASLIGYFWLRRKPASLFALGYVVEGPLMALLAVRLFLIRQSTPSIDFLLIAAGLGMAVFIWQLLVPHIQRGEAILGSLRLVGLTVMLVVSLYAAVWIAFYAVPIAGEFFKWLWRTLTDLAGFWRGVVDFFRMFLDQGWAWIPFTLLGIVLGLFTATLFVLAPLSVPILAVRAWLRQFSVMKELSSWLFPAALSILTVGTIAVITVLINNQPQRAVFELLQEAPASAQERQALIAQAEAIRQGLLNAYLASYRYISAVGEVNHVRDLYQNTFSLSQANALRVQKLYEIVTRPLLYEPVHPPEYLDTWEPIAFRRDPQEAAELYQRFFDEPIIEGERETIVDAVRSTWQGSQAEIAWQAVDDREIHLEQQEITVTENGDWAEIEIFETYRNQTYVRQEVVYYFNLPESAVITGVWLGNSPERSERFEYIVAPRGAAQQIYREQLIVQRDPALLEQIGPRQYRLRIFPVEPKISRYDAATARSITEDARPLYLWFTYQVFAEANTWPLPQLAFQRNIFWDQDTARMLNGKVQAANSENWLPESLPTSKLITAQAHRADFPNGKSVLAIPQETAEVPSLPENLRLAVVLDRSRSMAQQTDQTEAALAQFMEFASAGQPVDLYLASSAFSGEAPAKMAMVNFDPNRVVYFGGQNAAELLAQFSGLSEGQIYDSVFVLTDATGYELGQSAVDVPAMEAPLWVIHLGGKLPLGYDDETLKVIQASGGGIAESVNEALARMAFNLQNSSSNAITDLSDGYVWQVLPTDQIDTSFETAAEFTPLAARYMILGEMQQQRGELEQLAVLDQLHTLARQAGIVTPYSSMIVLVNQQQRRQLTEDSLQADRFEREYEEAAETTAPEQPPLTGVPEPEEWLLLGLAAAFLAIYAYRLKLAR
jgi:putative PEP-CTERM system integral membrane protein